MTSSPHGPYRLGYTRATMAVTEGRKRATFRKSQKPSQFGLGSATRPHEVGIASNRGSARHGEYVPGPCTHRPSHHENWIHQFSWCDGRCVQGPGTYSPWRADPRLLATPTSCRRVAAYNPDLDRFYEICSTSRYRFSLYRPL